MGDMFVQIILSSYLQKHVSEIRVGKLEMPFVVEF